MGIINSDGTGDHYVRGNNPGIEKQALHDLTRMECKKVNPIAVERRRVITWGCRSREDAWIDVWMGKGWSVGTKLQIEISCSLCLCTVSTDYR